MRVFSESFDLRLRPGQLAELHRRARAAGLTTSAYVRALALTEQPPRRRGQMSEIDAAAITALNKVGANLNQLTKLANAGQLDGAALSEILADVRAAVAKLGASR